MGENLHSEFKDDSSVSVIIAAYNAEQTIRYAIESALNQTGVVLEVIVVDDASTDSTASIVHDISDNRVRLLKRRTNSGPSVARNLALNEAKHDWIALLDADDWYSDSRLSRLIEIATVHAFDVVADDQWLYFESELAPVRKRSERLPIFANANPVKGVSLQELLSNVGLGIVQPVVRREMLEKHNVRYRNAYRFGEDFRFLYDLLSCGGRMGVVNEALYNVRLHGNSLTSNRVAMYSGMIEVLEGIMVDEAAAESQSGLAALRKAIRQARVTRNYGLVMDPLKNGEFLKAMVALAGNPALSFLIISRLFSRFNKRMSRKFSKDKV